MNEGDLRVCLVSPLKQSHEGTCPPFLEQSRISSWKEPFSTNTHPYLVAQNLGAALGELSKPLNCTQEAQLLFFTKLISIYLVNCIQLVVCTDMGASGEVGLGYGAISCETTGPCQLSKRLTSTWLVISYLELERILTCLWGQPLVGAFIYLWMSATLMIGTSEGLQREILFSSLMNIFSILMNTYRS